MRLNQSLLSALTIAFSSLAPISAAAAEASLTVERHAAPSRRKYLIIRPEHCQLDFVITRPKMKDPDILLSIPAAFTSSCGGLCGLYACQGRIGNENLVDRKIGGAIEINGSNCRIFDTKNGADLNSEFAAKLRKDRSSFFQQFQVVKDNHAEGFRDKTGFQRRCIAKFQDGKIAVIESDAELTFAEFAVDLVALGVENAIYTDMGPWSAGWYKAQNKVIPIGKSRLMTDKQTNWFLFKK